MIEPPLLSCPSSQARGVTDTAEPPTQAQLPTPTSRLFDLEQGLHLLFACR